MLKLLGSLAALGLIVLAVLASYAHTLLQPVALQPAPIVFEISKGAAFSHVAQRLEAEGLVHSALAAKLYARYHGVENRIQVGEYELSPHLDLAALLGIMTSGRVKTYQVTVPEGIRASEIADRLAEAGLADRDAFLTVVEDPKFARSLGVPLPTLEGYLYPDTYHLPRKLPPEAIARAMVEQFERVYASEIEAGQAATGLTKPQLVTLASIVEKETAAVEERPVIAAVFLNRLAKGMRLETDPTVIYGIANFDGNIRKRHLLDASNPYNTYRIRGLPPGPIASPGVDALRAVIAPSETEYLYFVSQNDGTHYFSETYREHTNAVNRFQKRRRRK
jgi:UPF0755 protein